MSTYAIDVSLHTTPRIMLFVPVAIAIPVGVLFLAEVVDGAFAFGWTGFCLLFALIGHLSWRRNLRGVIEVDEMGIRQVFRGGTMLFPWADIHDFKLCTLGDAAGKSSFIYKLLMIPTERKCVQVELKRWLKKHWWFSRWSAREPGIPLFAKKVLLLTSEPERLANDIQGLMPQPIQVQSPDIFGAP